MERNSIIDRIDSIRKAKAMAIAAQNVEHYHLASEAVRALVPSATFPGLDYTVILSNGSSSCNCEDALKRALPCKHIAATAIILSAETYVTERARALGIGLVEAQTHLTQERNAAATHNAKMRTQILLNACDNLILETALI
jgi:uncharacterized Zn finger protein